MMKHDSQLALAVGLVSSALTYLWLTLAHYQAHDFTWPWMAARLLLAGQNPYTDLHLSGGTAFADPFFYPLPAALLAIPFAPLPAEVAGALWAGLGAIVMAYALPRHLWPTLLSACAFVALRNAQWSPLLIGASLLSPWLLGLAAAKPTLGLALWVYRPSWKALPIAGGLLVLSFLALPSWPLGWLHNASAGGHQIPLLVLPFGPLLLLALLRWRDRNARLVLLLVCMPQMLYFYDQLPLFLVCRTRLQALLLAGLSWLAYALGPDWIVPLIYLPTLALVLAHPVQAEDRPATEVARCEREIDLADRAG